MHIPSFVGAFKVVSNTGTINIGDAFVIAPTSTSKTISGSGGAVTGDKSTTFTLFSATLTNAPDVIDDSNVKAAKGT